MTDRTATSTTNPLIGRVLRASTAGFAVGSQVNQLSLPGLGCLVKAVRDDSEAVFGLISDIHIDDDQLVQRLVMADNPPRSIIEDQRQNRMLPVEMTIITLGYSQNGRLQYGLPPRPPLNLDPVHLCVDEDEVCRFTAVTERGTLGYFRLITRAQSTVPLDQLLVAHVRDVYAKRGEDGAWLNTAVQEIIDLLRTDYEALMPTLEALSDLL